MVFPGFNKAKRSTVSSGDWDRDGVKNRKDCNAMDWKRQDGGEPFKGLKEYDLEMERIAIQEALWGNKDED